MFEADKAEKADEINKNPAENSARSVDTKALRLLRSTSKVVIVMSLLMQHQRS